jgi:hypothetical protein
MNTTTQSVMINVKVQKGHGLGNQQPSLTNEQGQSIKCYHHRKEIAQCVNAPYVEKKNLLKNSRQLNQESQVPKRENFTHVDLGNAVIAIIRSREKHIGSTETKESKLWRQDIKKEKIGFLIIMVLNAYVAVKKSVCFWSSTI